MNKHFLSVTINRLRTRLRDAEWRRYGALLLTGKLLGAAGSLLVAVIVSRKWWAGGFEWKFVRESLPIALPKQARSGVTPNIFCAPPSPK